jgi:exonuclease SbcD
MKRPRVLHLADLHIYLSGPRAEECRRIIDWIAANAAETHPDVIIIAGDVAERRMSPQERIYFAELMRTLSTVAPVFVISGNHDDRLDLQLFRKEYGWTMEVEVVLEPLVTRVPGVHLAFLPWPDLGNLAKSLATDSIAERREAAKAALLDVVRGFKQQIPEGEPSLLIAHLPVTGAAMDSGQPVSGGEEIALAPDELLESGAAGGALGHIHLRQQMVTGNGRPVWYAGAPFRGSFGEAKGTKGGLIWTWNGKAWDVEPWEVPARPMILIERTWIPAEEGDLEVAPEPLADPETVKDADVRVRITFPAHARGPMRTAMEPAIEVLRAAAHALTVEERTIVMSRTRCVEITEARTTMEKLQAWSQAVGAEIPDGIETKVGSLETVFSHVS